MPENQLSVGTWIDQTFPGTDPESSRKSLRALEEMVELCLASGADGVTIAFVVGRALDIAMTKLYPEYDSLSPTARGQLFATAHPDPGKIPAEAADVLIVLYGLAHMRQFDLHAAVDAKMLVNRNRRWRALGDGTGYHIPETPPGDTLGPC